MTTPVPGAVPPPSCLNCGAALQGRYCSECGQRYSPHHLGFHDLVHDAVHEFLHLDGKIFRTMKLLVMKPGALTREFLEGRRARYISPIRLYLTWSVIFFALIAIVPGAEETIKVRPSRPANVTMTPEEELRVAREGGSILVHALPQGMFVLMPVFGLLTWAFYRKRQPYYVAHLSYSVHFHALAFLFLSIILLVAMAGTAGRAAGSVIFLSLIPIHFISLRRVFGGSRKETTAKGLAIGIIYWLLMALWIVALALVITLGH